MVMPEHYTTGWHPSSTLGVFGSATACSKLLGLSHTQTASALTIVPSVVAGTKANFGTPMKPLQVGAAARNGLFAAKLAAAGCNAMADSIEGGNGFLKLFNEGISHPLTWNSSSQSRWFLLDPGIAIKQHPCCGSTHSAIDAAIDLYQRHGPIKLSDVDQVIVHAHPRPLGHTFKPKPTSGIEAKFSIQLVVAVALAMGSLRLSDFKEPFDSSPYKPLRAKLEVFRQLLRTNAYPPSRCGLAIRGGSPGNQPGSVEARTVHYPCMNGMSNLWAVSDGIIPKTGALICATTPVILTG
jgi:2-methylcitrate dehydratase PrpD